LRSGYLLHFMQENRKAFSNPVTGPLAISIAVENSAGKIAESTRLG
jgi:hypothetical protein